MVIVPTPISLPVSTVNLPTEAVAQQNIEQQRVPPVADVQAGVAARAGTDRVRITAPQVNGRNASLSSPTTAVAPQEATSANARQGSTERNAQLQAERAEDRVIQSLRQRDREVRNHEQAHANAGGELTGPPRLSYVRGPDGVLYARSGEVSIDISEVPNDPEATIRKMDKVIRAALAPNQPSIQDQRIAAKAAAIAAEARNQLAAEKREALQESEATNTEEGQEAINSESSNTSDASGNSSSDGSAGDPDAERRIQNIPQLIADTGAVDTEQINDIIGGRFSQSV